MSIRNGSRTQAIGAPRGYHNNIIRWPTDLANFYWVLFVGVTVFMLCLPFMHAIYWLGDEGVLLHGAERLLRGDTVYIDFFEFLPPGGFVIPAIWFGITGISIWSARLLAILTITGIACFTYLTCRQVSKHELSSALVAIGWAVMSQGFWTEINHHWFSTLFSMVAVWAALGSVENPQRRTSRPLIAGIAAGAAAMVTPTQGALSMLAAAACFVGSYRQRGNFIALMLGGALIPICLLAYVIEQGALLAAFNDVIRFTAERYASINSVPFGFAASPQNQPLIYLFPLLALLTVITCARDWQRYFHDRLFRSCVAFGLAGFILCFPRPDIFHIAAVTPLVCPLLTYCTHQIVASWPPKYRNALAALLVALAITPVAFYSLSAYAVLHAELKATPRGRVTFIENSIFNGMQPLLARIAAAPSSDRYFFYPYMPMLPFLTGREHVSKYDIFTPGYTTPSQYQEACISAMRRASWLVIDRNWTDPNFLKKIFPAISNAVPRETMKFELALQSGFAFVARDGVFELRRRAKTVDETACSGIAD